MPRLRRRIRQTQLSFAPDRLPDMRYKSTSATSSTARKTTLQPVSAVDEKSPKHKRSVGSSPTDLEPLTSSSPARSDSESSSPDVKVLIECPRRLQRVQPSERATPADDSDGSDGPMILPSAKRRRRNMDADVIRTPLRDSDQDRLDLEEDLMDLKDSAVKETRTRGRQADSARTKRQHHLEILRRRRAGDKRDSYANPEPDAEEGPEESVIGDRSNRSVPLQFIRGRRVTDSDDESLLSMDEDLDRYDNDFVLADETAELGVPIGSDEIPIEFTRHAYKQTKEYFQDAIEWMVHNQLNPAFPRGSSHFKFAFTKLEDEVRGRTSSQLLSSSWNVGFRRAIMARPHIEATSYPVIEQHACDACNRSGHPASSDIKLYGKAYSLETLEALSDENSDSERSEDNGERDGEGNILPGEGRRFLLGKHCMKMATLAHTLIHWRFHLNEWVTGYLEYKGVLSDEEILKRNRWSQAKKARFANETLAAMIEAGEVQRLWRDFHINLKTARETTSHG